MKKTTPATSGSRSLLPEIETEPKLTKRQMLANMASGGVISPNMSAWVAAWAKRSRFNPIRMLTPDLLSRQIDNFQMGYLRDFALMAEAIKRRDYMVQTSTRKREKAISRHGIDVITNDHIEKELKDQAKLHASALTYFYDNLHARNVMEQDQAGGKRLLIQQMMEAVYYRYAVHEIVWRPSVDPVTGAARLTADFNYVPLYFFETQTAHLRFLKRYFGTIMGDEMEQGEWLVTVADGIAEAIAVCYMFKTMPLKDWVSFSERFGTPGILGKTKAAFNSQQWKEMEDALRKFAQDWTAVTAVDNGIELIIPQGSTGNNTVFAPLVELMDKAIATICRGADLSTISSGHQSQGHGSSLQGGKPDGAGRRGVDHGDPAPDRRDGHRPRVPRRGSARLCQDFCAGHQDRRRHDRPDRGSLILGRQDQRGLGPQRARHPRARRG
jgi:phage gp29-like protein